MRIRQYPAIGFAVLTIASAFLGLAPSTIPSYKQSDKVLHFVTFFLLTLCFYWAIETTRRRNLQLTLLAIPVVLGIGSEIVQGLLPNGRNFDPYDIAANVLGCLPALAISTWYHKRMLERKRLSRSYTSVAGEDEDPDLELGEGLNGQRDDGEHEDGVVLTHVPPRTLEQEVDNWDENGDDWDEDEPSMNTAANGAAQNQKVAVSLGDDASHQVTESKKRND